MSTLIQKLIEKFQILPGVGPRTARRFVYHILERSQNSAIELADLLSTTVQTIQHCEKCRNLTEHPVCEVCLSPKRDLEKICILESPQDVDSIEHTGCYKGLYFILHGKLSPLDGLGPEELGLNDLFSRILSPTNTIKEIIIATNATVEGEATAYYISEQLSSHVKITRLASGIPRGGEIEYLDPYTLAHSFQTRQQLESTTEH